MTEYVAIDTDTHVGEPADLWTSRLPEAGDAVPHVKFNEDKQRHEWWVGDTYITLAPAGTVVGANVIPPANPKNFDDAHPAAFDIEARKALMDEEGIWAQVLYPNVAGFGGQHFMKIEDPALRVRTVEAYNDYVMDWIGEDRDRFVGVCMIPFWDVDAAVREVERSHALGHRAVLMTGKPDVWWGQPHIVDPYWNKLWEVATSLGMSISYHAGGSDPAEGWQQMGYPGMPARTRFTANTIPGFFGSAQSVIDLIFGGVLERYPQLEVVIVESGIGWVSFLLECMDYQFHEHRIRDVSPELKLLPSEYFHRQILTTFWFERIAPARLLDHVGADNVMFESDFPHPTSLWPPQSVKDQVLQCMADHSQETRDKVFWKNAARLYGIQMPQQALAGV